MRDIEDKVEFKVHQSKIIQNKKLDWIDKILRLSIDESKHKTV